MSWKQPISTECRNLDTITRLVYLEISSKLQPFDAEFPITVWNGDQRHNVLLKKGECVFSINEFSKETGISYAKIRQSLKILTNAQTLNNHFTITRKSFGLIVKPINVDEFFKIEVKSQTLDKQTTNTSQSIKDKIERVENKEEEVEEKPTTPVIEKSRQEKWDERLHLIEFVKTAIPILQTAPHIREIIDILESKPLEDREPFVRFVATNKSEKVLMVKGWREWFWNDYWEHKNKPSGQSKVVITDEQLTWYKEMDINPYGPGSWEDQYKPNFNIDTVWQNTSNSYS